LDQLKHNQRRRHASQEIRGSAWDPEHGGDEGAKFIAAIKLPHLASPRLGVYQDSQRPPRESLLASFKARREILWQDPDPALVEQPPKSARPPRKSPRAIKALPQLGLSTGDESIDSLGPLKSLHDEDLASTTLDPGSTWAETSYLNTTTLPEESSQFSLGPYTSKKLAEDQMSLASMAEPPEPAPEPAVEDEVEPPCHSAPPDAGVKQISPPSTVYEVSSSGADEARTNDMKGEVASDVLAVITNDAVDFLASSGQGLKDPAPGAVEMDALVEKAWIDEDASFPSFEAAATAPVEADEEEAEAVAIARSLAQPDVADATAPDALELEAAADAPARDATWQHASEMQAVADEPVPLETDSNMPAEGFDQEEHHAILMAVPPPVDKDPTDASEESLPFLAEVLEEDGQFKNLLSLAFPPLDLSFDFLLKLDKDWAEELPHLMVDDMPEEAGNSTESKAAMTFAPEEAEVVVAVSEKQGSALREPHSQIVDAPAGAELVAEPLWASVDNEALPELDWQPWEDSTAGLALSEPQATKEAKHFPVERRVVAEDEVPRCVRIPSKQERIASNATRRLPSHQDPILASMPAESDLTAALAS